MLHRVSIRDRELTPCFAQVRYLRAPIVSNEMSSHPGIARVQNIAASDMPGRWRAISGARPSSQISGS
jgi:hypothetical protein